MERISIKQVNNSERFFRVPKQFFESPRYKKMSADSKLLYAILKDRFELSLKNNWVDEDGNIYFIFTIEEIVEMMGCGKDKAIKLKKELAKYELLEEVRQGVNKPNLIYLGILSPETSAKPLVQAEVDFSDFRNSENQKSGLLKNRIQEVGKSEPNDTDISDTNNSDTDFIIEEDEERQIKNSYQEEKEVLSRKVDKVTKYDKEYIWELVHDQLLKENFSKTTSEFILLKFDDRYQYALEHMRFARSSEKLAEYVFNGLLAEWHNIVRKREGIN